MFRQVVVTARTGGGTQLHVHQSTIIVRGHRQNSMGEKAPPKPLKEDDIAVLPILADVVKVKESGSTAHWSIDFIRLNGWLRRCFTLLITPPDIDWIGQNWEDSNMHAVSCPL